MGKTFDDLLDQMPSIAEAVNAFESEAAQLRALEVLLGMASEDAPPPPGGSVDEEVPPPETPEADKEPPKDAQSDRPRWMEDLVAGLPDAHLVTTQGTREHQLMWGLIQMLTNEEDATEKNIRKLLNHDLGVKINRTQASSKLKGFVPRYASREKVGHSFAYRPKASALGVFDGLTEDSE